MRAALQADRIPMMELLVARGANVNATWDGKFPVIFEVSAGKPPSFMRQLRGKMLVFRSFDSY